ncbi:actin-histidine N-methyltransferase isoform X1 [Osmia bicornis bicornis]|uniref:actin-histidine N-methyltransferase isoform X1 n=2 Tax=Osmia bicornis bicornis TaxID=1437191 RepID=UPI001EAF228C|nr:actin-histidine N-methyltransferase isoform X1 [Osmia bicornis bicornis]
MDRRAEINALCEELLRLSTNSVDQTKVWNNYVQIITVLGKIKRLEKMKTESSKRSQGIGQLINWLKENNANVDGASVAEFPGYDLGLKAERDFLENELILKIPRNLIFNTVNAAPELTALKNDPLIQDMPQVALAIALLIERHKENSKWKAYLDILPTTYTTVMYMTAADMIELKGSPTLVAALKQCRNIARQYSYFNKIFQNDNNAVSAVLRDVFTYDRYCWAVSTVMTRQNLIPSEDGSRMIHSLIPMWDMCNHENGTITTDFNLTSDCCECYALKEFKKGDQIFISYGVRTNSDFFVHSGFVYMDNKQDAIKLWIGPLLMTSTEPCLREREQLLRKLHLTVMSEFLVNSGVEPIPGSMLAYLRLFRMRKPELMHWLKSDRVNDLKQPDCPLDTAINDKVKKALIYVLESFIARYPTTLQEDLQLLETTLPQFKKLAIQLRVTEKRIIFNALEYVRTNES